MLHKEIQQPDFVIADLRERFDNMVSDEIGSAGLGGQSELFLEPSHGAGAGVSLGGGAKDVEYTERQGPEAVEQAREESDEKKKKKGYRCAGG